MQVKRLCRTGWRTVLHPAWHPKGEKIYLVISEREYGATGYDIYWIDIHGGPNQKPQKIIGCPDQVMHSPYVSKNENQIVFAHYPSQSDAFKLELWMAKLSRVAMFFQKLRYKKTRIWFK